MNLYLLLLLSASAHVITAIYLYRMRRANRRYNLRIEEWYRSMRLPDTNRWRGGGAITDALIVLAFCAAIAAAILLCLSDIDLLTLR